MQPGPRHNTHTMDTSKIDNIEWGSTDRTEYYAESADYDGRPMTQDEIIRLNEEERDWLYEQLMEHLY